MAGLFPHETASPAPEREPLVRGADSEPRRSLFASPWFWAGGLLSLAIWIGLYVVFVR